MSSLPIKCVPLFLLFSITFGCAAESAPESALEACGAACRGAVKKLEVGDHRSCALFEAGGVACWGLSRGVDEDFSPDGADKAEFGFTEIAVPLHDVVDLSVADRHTCAVRKDGSVWCWGSNTRGQLGLGTVDEGRKVPTRVPGIENAIRVQDTTVWLADGGMRRMATEVTDPTVGDASLFDVADFHWGITVRCDRMKDGRVRCSGDNQAGQLGRGPEFTDEFAEMDFVPGLSDITDLHVGLDFVCALHADGGVSCWGDNHGGALGNGVDIQVQGAPGSSNPTPTRVPGLTDVVALSGHPFFTCAQHADGTMSCWGSDPGSGILPSVRVVSPIKFPFEGIVSVEMTGGHGCMIMETGDVACFGGMPAGGSEWATGAPIHELVTMIPADRP